MTVDARATGPLRRQLLQFYVSLAFSENENVEFIFRNVKLS